MTSRIQSYTQDAEPLEARSLARRTYRMCLLSRYRLPDGEAAAVEVIRAKFEVLKSVMDERTRRL